MKEIIQPTSEVSIQPAVEILDYIANIEIPESAPEEEILELFDSHEFGHVFVAILETHGAVTIRSSGYKQLSGTFNGDYFNAMLRPGYIHRDKPISPSIHAIITPARQWNPISAVTMYAEAGNPLVQRSIKPSRHANNVQSGPLDPRESLKEVQRLATVMSGFLAVSHSEAESIPELILA